MEQLITSIAPYIPAYCWPLVIAAGLYYIISKQRKDTKETRDKDSIQLHDDILSLKFKVSNLEGQSINHDQLINDLREQISLLNTNIVKLSVIIENMEKDK